MEFDPPNGNLLMLNQWMNRRPTHVESDESRTARSGHPLPGTHRAPQQGSHPTNAPGPRQQQTLQRGLGLSMPAVMARNTSYQ